MSTKIISPPGEDPLKYFDRWRRKPVWARVDWRKGVGFGLMLALLFAGVALTAGFKVAAIAAGALFGGYSLLRLFI